MRVAKHSIINRISAGVLGPRGALGHIICSALVLGCIGLEIEIHISDFDWGIISILHSSTD